MEQGLKVRLVVNGAAAAAAACCCCRLLLLLLWRQCCDVAPWTAVLPDCVCRVSSAPVLATKPSSFAVLFPARAMLCARSSLLHWIHSMSQWAAQDCAEWL